MIVRLVLVQELKLVIQILIW